MIRIYNIRMWQAWLLVLLSGYVGNLFLSLVTMWISAKTKSAVLAVTTPFILIFLPSFLEGIPGWIGKMTQFMPSSLLEFYQSLASIQIFTLFGRVFRTLDVAIGLYLVLVMALIPAIYREFRKKATTIQ